MATVNLQDEETAEIDLGDSSGLSARNVSTANAKFHIDYCEDGSWKPVTGVTLVSGATRSWTRVGLGHEHVLVGAKGLDDGKTIVEVTY